MASIIQAVRVYGPRISLKDPVKSEHFRDRIIEVSRQSTGMVANIQISTAEALLEFLLEGRPVQTELAIFTPSIDLDGSLRVNVRMNKPILSALNKPGAFKGKVERSENIGMSSQEIAARWNGDHPDNPIKPGPEPG
jgi:hypothetical protein